MFNPRTDLPSPSAPNFEQRIRETLMTYLGRQGNPLDRGVTLRDLLENGLARVPDGYTLRPGANSVPLKPVNSTAQPDLTPPPQPTGFQVASAISHLFIEHDAPIYPQGHKQTRVYGVTVATGDPLPTFDDAVEITQFSGSVHAHPSNPATTWRLWIKWESLAGVLSPTPAGGTNGLEVTTGQDVTLLLEALTGQITESQLYEVLGARINLIDGPATTPGTVNARVQAETTARTQALDSEANARSMADDILNSAVSSEVSSRQMADSTLQSSLSAVGAAAGQAVAAVKQEADSRTSADEAFAGTTTTLVAAQSASAAAIQVEQATRANDDAAAATQTLALAASLGANVAAIKTEEAARTTGDSALAQQVTTLGVSLDGKASVSAVNALQIQVDTIDGAVVAQGQQITQLVAEQKTDATDLRSAIEIEELVRTAETEALAEQTTRLEVSFAKNAAAITQEAQARADADSAEATLREALAATVATGDSDNAAALVAEQGARADADTAQAASSTTLAVAVGANAAALATQYEASSDADAAQAQQTATLAAATASTAAGLFTEQTVRAEQDGAQAANLAGLAVSSGASSAGLLSEQQARVTDDTALASRVDSMAAATGANAAAIMVEEQARTTQDASLASQITTVSAATQETSAALTNEISVRAAETGALAQQVTTLQAASKDDEAALEIEAFVRNIETETLLGQYTVKVDINGYVSGFGLASEKRDGKTVSNFAVRADQFYIASPEGPGVKPAMPFIVRTTPTTINGVEVPVGVYMTDAFIQNGTITTAKIANLAVDDAKIANLNVSKLKAGSVAVGEHIQSTGYVAGSSGWRINGNGNAEFSGVVVRGTVYAVDGQIGGITISGNAVRAGQTAYNTGSGFHLGSDGRFSLGSGTGNRLTWDGANLSLTGSLNAATGTFTGTVSGGQFTTGAFTSYAWPAAGNYGSYLGPSGLLIGNFNNGKYLQVTQDGNIYTPGFDVVNGAMTVKQANVINTLNLAGNAVTVPVAAAASNEVNGASGEPTLISAAIASSGAPIFIMASVNGRLSFAVNSSGQYMLLRLRRNGAVIYEARYENGGIISIPITLVDTPGAGVFTYSITTLTDRLSGSGVDTYRITNRGIVLLEVKR